MPYKPLEKGDKQQHPALQLLMFICIFAAVFIAGNLAGFGIVAGMYGLKPVLAISTLSTNVPNFSHALWILQITGATLPILISPLIFIYAYKYDPQVYIKPSFRFPLGLLVLVLAIMFISNPVIELLSNLNQKMVLPPFLKWMRDSEDNAQKLMKVMLQMNTIWNAILKVLLIGFVTALAEELMFRGIIQTIFIKWTKNPHAAIWITAILFSAFHMEFFGFLPRLLLGVLFGYFVVWSGSIWTSVWAHFINNGTVVIVTYLFQQKMLKINPDDEHVFNSAAYIISLVVMLLLLFIYRKICQNVKPAMIDTDGKELD